jgi:hypothetical protein
MYDELERDEDEVVVANTKEEDHHKSRPKW